VLVDDPCYFNFRALLKTHGVNVVGVPYTLAGPRRHRIRSRARDLSPALHNLTGATMSLASAHKLPMEAAPHDHVIVEDDIFPIWSRTRRPDSRSTD
jgi:DNA-binding transcriptional MocR family regulator